MTDEINQESLRGTSDGLLIAIREVDAWERQKRGVRPADPEFVALAREVRVAAEELLRLAREEEVRAGTAAVSRDAVELPTINATEPPPTLAAILAEWRAVERRLEAVDPASAEAAQLMEAFQVLRARYAEALSKPTLTSMDAEGDGGQSFGG